MAGVEIHSTVQSQWRHNKTDKFFSLKFSTWDHVKIKTSILESLTTQWLLKEGTCNNQTRLWDSNQHLSNLKYNTTQVYFCSSYMSAKGWQGVDTSFFTYSCTVSTAAVWLEENAWRYHPCPSVLHLGKTLLLLSLPLLLHPPDCPGWEE